MLDIVNKLGSGIAALIAGQVVGIASSTIAERIAVSRQSAEAAPTNYDVALDTLIETTFIILGITLIERGIPSVTSNLDSLMLFTLGIMFAQRRIPANLQTLEESFLNQQQTA